MNKDTGEVLLRGRGENDKDVGVIVNDYEHFFYLSRQTPFVDQRDAAQTLSFLDQGLRIVASGYDGASKKQFKTPDPRYKSRTCAPRTVYVSDKIVTAHGSIITGWSFVNDKKTIYGWTPEAFREPMLIVYVRKPCYSSLIHQYIESDHFRRYYCGALRIPDVAFFRDKMLRTFEASLNTDLVFRTKYDIWMSRWCTVNTKSPTCYTNVPKRLQKIHCDEYYSCNAKDVSCDVKRDDNANFVRMAFDIECPGKMKRDGNSRFPIAHWGSTKFIEYAKDVLSLPPPTKGFCNVQSKRSFGSQYDAETTEEEEETDDLCSILTDMSSITEEEDDDDGDSNKNQTDEEIKIKNHNEWIRLTKAWLTSDWLSWLSWALKKKYTPAQLTEMVKKANLDKFDDLIPDPERDTDRVRCICVAVKDNNRNVGDNPLDFTKRVAFAYEDVDMLEKIRARPRDAYGANIWDFPSIDVRTFDCEAQMINAYVLYRREVGVDIEESWNGRSFDHVYLFDRLVYLQTYGTENDKRYSKDLNFGFLKGDDIKSRCIERFTSSKAGGDKLERSVTQELVIHNDGLQIITNTSFGEKNRHNTLDYISMLKLIHSRSNIDRAIDQMIADGVADEDSIRRLYCEKYPSSHAQWTKVPSPTLKAMMKAVFEDVPMRKMQFDLNEGMGACMTGGTAFRDFIDYCYVDACLPILIGGKLSLQIAISRATNVTPSDVFERGVQMKVLALIYSMCKRVFKGLYLIPDKGSLWLHWPCVFDDDELGFEEAVVRDPRLCDTLWSNKFKKSEEELEEERLNRQNDDINAIEDLFKPAPKNPTKGNARRNTKNSKTLARTTTNNNNNNNKTPNPSTSGVKKTTAAARKAAAARKKKQKKGYTGACVIPPTRRGPIEQPVPTLDFASLYPSICYSRGLCYTTFLTSKSIAKYKLERWQYSRYVLGMASEISCGKHVVDAKAALDGGYYSNELKIAHFYSAVPLTTVYGALIKQLKILRKGAKDKMQAADDSLEDIKIHVDDGVPLAKGSRQERYYNEGMPLPLIKRLFEIEYDTYNNMQLALKICNNSGYGFPAVNPEKAILPCMEIGATITATGRAELTMSKSIAQRFVETVTKEYVEKRTIVIERESIVDPVDDKKRVSKIDGKDYPLWKVGTSYVIDKLGEGRKPLINCSALSRVSDAWMYETRHDRISPNKIDVLYGDSVIGNTALIVRVDGTLVQSMRIDELIDVTDKSWSDYRAGEKSCAVPTNLEVWQDGGFTKVNRVIKHACKKRVIRVLTRTGIVDCTEDHSLLTAGDATRISPKDAFFGTRLLHAHDADLIEFLSNKRPLDEFDTTITIEEAYIMGAFLADWVHGERYASLISKYPDDTKETISRACLGLFCNYHGEKTIPWQILSAPIDVVERFCIGFLRGKGSNKTNVDGVTFRLYQHGKDVCNALWILFRRLGLDVRLRDVDDHPDVFVLTCTVANTRKTLDSVRKLYDITDNLGAYDYDGYVYDLETENHHFHVGPGSMVVHNTDSIMMEFRAIDFTSNVLLQIQNVAESSRFIAYHINRFEYEEMSLVFEKLALGMLLKEKKNYMMRLVSEVNGKTREFFERGGSIKRDCLPIVKNIIDAHKESILEAMGRGEALDDVLDVVSADIKRIMNDLYEGNYVFDDLILSKKITKIAYKKEPEHIVVASNNKKRDNPMSVGSSVFYSHEFKPFMEAEFGSFDAYLKKKRTYDIESKRLIALERQKNSMIAWSGTKRDRSSFEASNDRSTSLPVAKRPRAVPRFKRKQKGIKIAEDAIYMKEMHLTPDIRYIYEHRIKNPLLAHFAPVFFPRSDMPYLDTDRMNPAKLKETEKVQKRMKKEQQKATCTLLFGEFEEKMDRKTLSICENAYQTHLKTKKTTPVVEAPIVEESKNSLTRYFTTKDVERPSVLSPIVSSNATLRPSEQRYCECINCHVIEKMIVTDDTLLFDRVSDNDDEAPIGDVKRTTNDTTLPGIICDACKRDSHAILRTITNVIREGEELQNTLLQRCTACVYLLDNPALDSNKCKSSHCSVFQQKKKVEATLTFKRKQWRLFKKVDRIPRTTHLLLNDGNADV